FLDHELNSPGGGVASASQLLNDLIEFASRSDPSASKEAFWPLAAARLLRMVMNVIYLGTGTCTFRDVYRVISSLPETPQKLTDPAWQNSPCGLAIGLARLRAGERKVEFFVDYLLEELPGLDYRTRSNIMAQVMNTVDPFMQGDLTPL